MKGKQKNDSCSMNCCKSAASCPFCTTLLGLLVVANAYWGWVTWSMFIGIALVVYGISLFSCACPGKHCCNK